MITHLWSNHSQFSQFSHSVVSNSATPWTPACQAFLSFTICQSLFKFMCIESVMLSKHLILCHPLFVCLQSFPASVFPNEWSLCTRRTQYWSFSFNISPSNAYSGLISLRIDLFDLAVQRALKSFLQHYSSKASIPWSSAFFMVQLSYPHMTTGKTIALTNMDLCKQNDVSAF